MSFRVEPTYLTQYGQQVERASEDSAAVTRYLNSHPLPQGLGDNGLHALIGPVAAMLDKAMTAATTATGKVGTVLDTSGAALTEAATWYQHTDQAVAARLDATVPTRCPLEQTTLERRWQQAVCGPWFADSRDPSARLVSVDDVEFSHPLAFFDYFSPSHYLLTAFDHIWGFNPLERALESLLGDWQAVARAGVAFGHAADAMDDLAYNVQGGAIALQQGWQGAAADAAYFRFTRLADGAENVAGPFREIAKQFTAIADGIYQTSEAVSGALKSLCDAGIVAGVAFIAGTATMYSGVGAVVGYSVAAVEVATMLKMWADATGYMNNAYAAVQASLGIVEGQMSRVYEAVPKLDDYSAYRHPNVPDWVGAR